MFSWQAVCFIVLNQNENQIFIDKNIAQGSERILILNAAEFSFSSREISIDVNEKEQLILNYSHKLMIFWDFSQGSELWCVRLSKEVNIK